MRPPHDRPLPISARTRAKFCVRPGDAEEGQSVIRGCGDAEQPVADEQPRAGRVEARPVGIVATGRGRLAAIGFRPHRAGEARAFAVGADDEPRPDVLGRPAASWCGYRQRARRSTCGAMKLTPSRRSAPAATAASASIGVETVAARRVADRRAVGGRRGPPARAQPVRSPPSSSPGRERQAPRDSSRRPSRRRHDTPAGWMKWPDIVSLGKVVRSMARTFSPSRASISARADPAQRAPMITTSYICPLSSSRRSAWPSDRARLGRSAGMAPVPGARPGCGRRWGFGRTLRDVSVLPPRRSPSRPARRTRAVLACRNSAVARLAALDVERHTLDCAGT